MLTFRHIVSAPGIEAALDTIGDLLMRLKDDLNTAIAQDKADADLVIAKLTEFAGTVATLVQKIDDLTAAAEIDPDTVRGVITHLKAEHDALTAALAGGAAPAPTLEPEPTPDPVDPEPVADPTA